MDPRIFAAGTMNLAAHVRGKPPRYRTPRVAQWYEARKDRKGVGAGDR
jgi:hypothetical protein